ncbi:AMP-binding protein [Mesorhizobium cantuariense]|uniref:AMP-binding protein n=1 Tax=Mesorhizobium cantuariense TaxID=1300275 RepID=A0ABV7MNX0_9HYPH
MVPVFATDLARYGDSPALLIDRRPPISYAELARRVTAFGEQLGAQKCLIALEAASSEHAVTAYLGALAGGHSVALLPPDEPQAIDAFREKFAPDVVYRRVDRRWRLEKIPADAQGALHPDLALLLTTSGSTGHGKGVRLSSTAVEANARAIAEYLDLRTSDRTALVLPLHYSYGLSVLNSHLAVGGSIYLTNRSVLDDNFLEALEKTGCTNLSGVPFTYELLERIGFRERLPSRLRFMTVAGGRLEPGLVRAYHARLAAAGRKFFVMYGQTEATARIAYLPPELAGTAPDRIGIAIPGGELSLQDDKGRPISEPGVPGEIVYRGPNVMMGYAQDRADLARGPEVDALHTGDIACSDAGGLYRIVGRQRRMSKIAGIRIGHDALETALAAEGIPAAVVGNDETILAAYTAARSSGEVCAYLARATGLTLRHVKAVRLMALPRLASGKIDYLALKARLEEEHADRQGVAEAFRQAFFPHPVGEEDSFTSLGGDSLRYVEISMVLDRRLGYIPNRWERMSLAELARLRPERHPKRAVGSDLVVRALAILLVVTQHATLWPVPGGAAAMTVLIGYAIARFQKESLLEGDFARYFRPLALILFPYYAILAGYALAWGTVPWTSVFLVGNFGFADPVRHTMLPFLYWFVEVYVQMLVVLAALFLIPAVRATARQDPFLLGLLLLLSAVALRFVGPVIWPIGERQIFTLPWVFYLCAFGWCAASADTRQRRLMVLFLALIVMPLVAYASGNWIGSWIKYGLQIGVLATLLYVPRFLLPSWASAVVVAIAAASYHIYLLHRLVPELLIAPIEASVPGWLFTSAAILGGLALGLIVHSAQSKGVAFARSVASADWNSRMLHGGRQLASLSAHPRTAIGSAGGSPEKHGGPPNVV